MTAPRGIPVLLLGAILLSAAGPNSVAANGFSRTSGAVGRYLQNTDVTSVCPDGSQCQNGETCSKTGETTTTDFGVLEEYECDDCTGSQCARSNVEPAAEVYCVVGSGANPSTTFCVNGGRCINDGSGNQDRAGCECADGYEGPNCQMVNTDSTEQIEKDPSNPNEKASEDDPQTLSSPESKKLSGAAIFGICFAAFVVTMAAALLIRRRMDRRDEEPPSVVDASVGESQTQGHNPAMI